MEIYKTDEESEIDLRQFKDKFDDNFNRSEMARLLLTLKNCKPATDVEGFFKTEEKFQELVSEMNSTGLNCYVEKNPDETMTESFLQFFDEEGMEDDRDMVDEAELVAWIFVTEEIYDEKFFRPIIKAEYGSEYHRRYGSFLEFEDSSIEAYVYFNMPRWRKIIYRIFNERPRKSVQPLEAAKKYRPDLSDQDLKILTGFTFGRIPDSKEFLDRKVKEAFETKEIIENSKLSREFFLESLSNPKLME